MCVEPARQPHHEELGRAVDACGLHPDVELEDVGLEGDLAAPREEMHVVAAQGRAAVAQHLRGEKDAHSAAWGRASRRVRRAARSLESLPQEAGGGRAGADAAMTARFTSLPCHPRKDGPSPGQVHTRMVACIGMCAQRGQWAVDGRETPC